MSNKQEEIIYLEDDLKPCAYCGGNGVIYASGSYTPKESTEARYLYDVKCLRCGMGSTESFLSLADAKNLWNKRYSTNNGL